MSLKVKQKIIYDYHELERLVEEKSGKDTRDWAGRFLNQPSVEDYKTGNFPMGRWAAKHGYICNENVWCSTYPNPEELALRIEINQKYREAEDGERLEKKISYQDFWHYATDNFFYEVSNGCLRYFNPFEVLESLKLDKENGALEEKDYFVIEILEYFVEVFKENNLPEEIEVEISW